MLTYLIPIFIIFLITYSFIKKQNTYSFFINGAKSSFDVILTTLPYLLAIFIALELYNASGISRVIANLLSPLFQFIGIPSELNELIIIKHLSGSGSLGVLENIYLRFGADSYISRCASTIMGSSEAILFILAVYLGKTNVKKFAPAIIISIISNILTAMFICFICKFI